MILNYSRHKLSPKQYQFVTSKTRYTLYSGAIRSGKTLALIYRMLVLAKPNTRGLIGTYDYPMIRDIILPKLFDVLTAYPRSSWEFKKSDKNLIIKHPQGNAVVMIRNLKDSLQHRGKDLNWYLIDEGTVGILKETFEELNGRLSEKGASAGVVTNPGLKSHWLYQFYYKCPVSERKNRMIIQTNIYDNRKHLPADYLKDMETRPNKWKEKYLKGEWGSTEGIIYDNFDYDKHVRKFKVDPEWDFYLGIDFGYTNPFACLLIGVDKDLNPYIIEEHYKSKMRLDQHTMIIKERFIDKYDIKGIVCDPSDAMSKNTMQRSLGFRFINGIKKVAAGIEYVHKVLEDKTEKGMRLSIDKDCINIITEFESYEWERNLSDKNQKEEPRKYMDHALDALRYFLMTIVRKNEILKD